MDNLKHQVFENLGYEVLGPLGSGSFGEVMKMKTQEEHIIAVKIVPKNKVQAGERTLWPLLQHTNILKLNKVHDIIEHPGYYAFEMPAAKCGLDTMIESPSFSSDPEAMNKVQKWTKEILQGVYYLHQKDMVHLDLKTDNVLLTDDEECVICDFTYLNEMKQPITKCGTPLHLRAPEACPSCGRNLPLDGEKVDLWTTGMMILDLVTGFNITENLPYPPTSWKGDIYPSLFEMLQKEHFYSCVRAAMPVCNISTETLESLRNFILMFLNIDPAKRSTAETALNHLFLKKGGYSGVIPSHWEKKITPDEVGEILRKFRANLRPKTEKEIDEHSRKELLNDCHLNNKNKNPPYDKFEQEISNFAWLAEKRFSDELGDMLNLTEISEKPEQKNILAFPKYHKNELDTFEAFNGDESWLVENNTFGEIEQKYDKEIDVISSHKKLNSSKFNKRMQPFQKFQAELSDFAWQTDERCSDEIDMLYETEKSENLQQKNKLAYKNKIDSLEIFNNKAAEFSWLVENNTFGEMEYESEKEIDAVSSQKQLNVSELNNKRQFSQKFNAELSNFAWLTDEKCSDEIDMLHESENSENLQQKNELTYKNKIDSLETFNNEAAEFSWLVSDNTFSEIEHKSEKEIDAAISSQKQLNGAELNDKTQSSQQFQAELSNFAWLTDERCSDEIDMLYEVENSENLQQKNKLTYKNKIVALETCNNKAAEFSWLVANNTFFETEYKSEKEIDAVEQEIDVNSGNGEQNVINEIFHKKQNGKFNKLNKKYSHTNYNTENKFSLKKSNMNYSSPKNEDGESKMKKIYDAKKTLNDPVTNICDFKEPKEDKKKFGWLKWIFCGCFTK